MQASFHLTLTATLKVGLIITIFFFTTIIIAQNRFSSERANHLPKLTQLGNRLHYGLRGFFLHQITQLSVHD